jgi:hypothetical protein
MCLDNVYKFWLAEKFVDSEKMHVRRNNIPIFFVRLFDRLQILAINTYDRISTMIDGLTRL